jgi:hypothetical protein
MPGRDTKTRFQGVFARHQDRCRVSTGAEPKTCNCTPSYFGVVWDRAARKQRKTRRFRGVTEAQGPGGRARAWDCALGGRCEARGCARPVRCRSARRGRAQQVGPALPAQRVEGPRGLAELAARRDRQTTARGRHPGRRPAPGRRHDAPRRVGLARPECRQRPAFALSLGTGPRPGRPRPGRERAAPGHGRQASRPRCDARGIRATARPQSPRTQSPGR